jgi:hypothetical protein
VAGAINTPPLLQNTGVVDAYETIPFCRYARAVTDSDYRGEFYLVDKEKGDASLKEWSPSKFVFHVALKTGNSLVINQNFWPGWHTSQGTLKDYQGLLAVDLRPGVYDVTVRYLPVRFLIGIGIFILMIAVSTIVIATKKQRD